MAASDLVVFFVAPLNRLGVPYMITGSAAASIYGEPRYTRDIDVLVALTPADAPRISSAFDQAEFYVAPEDVIREEIARRARGHFNVVHVASGLKADYYVIGDDPLHAWAMAKRQPVVVDGHEIFLAPAAYVVIRKLAWFKDGGSEKHLEDVRKILRVRGDRLDHAELAPWIESLGLQSEWKRVSAT